MRKYNDLFKDLEHGALFVIEGFKTVLMKRTEMMQVEPSGIVRKNAVALSGTNSPGNLHRFNEHQKCWKIPRTTLISPRDEIKRDEAAQRLSNLCAYCGVEKIDNFCDCDRF